MAFCRNCGKKVDDGARFCPACGAPTAGEIRYGAPAERQVIIERRVVPATSYNEISFAGSVYFSWCCRVILYFATLLCTVFAGIAIFLVAKNSVAEDYGSLFTFLLFASTGLPVIVYGVIYALTHIKKAFGKIDGETTMYTLYKMQRFQITQIPVLIFGFIMIIVGFIVPAARVNGTFGGIGYAFTEPELVDLALGAGKAKQLIFGLVYFFVYVAYIAALIYSTHKVKIFWRYFKGRIAPRAEQPKGVKKRKLINKNAWLATALGAHYDNAVKPYVSVRFRDKSTGYGVNSEPNYVKYSVFNIVKPVAFVAVILALLITYCAIVPPHLNQPVRLGKAAQVRPGYTHAQVEEILGEPSATSTSYKYVYRWDNVDIDEIEDMDDWENIFDSDFKELVIIVEFDKRAGEDYYFVTGVLFDTDYISGESFKSTNLEKELKGERREYDNYGHERTVTTIIKFYKNGSMKIE